MRLLFGLILGTTLLLTSCDGSTTIIDPGSAGGTPGFERELAALELPPGVDPVLWESLKAEFRAVMRTASNQRSASRVPNSEESRVSDLEISGTAEGKVTLRWTYRNPGDYNQDKLVNVSDITPLGIYFGAKIGDDNWADASRTDGNHDGMITVSDISPLGFNYLNRVEGYHVYADANGTVPLADVLFAGGSIPPGEYWYRFDWMLAGPVDGACYTVRPYDGADSGLVSNPAQHHSALSDVDVTVPVAMAGGLAAQWVATWSGGTPPLSIIWEFDGGAEDFGRANALSPNHQTVTMLNPSRSEAAAYTYTVTVTDSLGITVSASGEYTVGANPHPNIVVTVPEDMVGSYQAWWRAEWTGGMPPFIVDFDFGAGGQEREPFEVPGFTATPWIVMNNANRMDAATYEYALTVTDSLGFATTVTGDYEVGPDPHPLVTVAVPDSMSGDTESTWGVEWVGGTGPYTVSWHFNNGAEDPAPAAATSPHEQIVSMINYNMELATTYEYDVDVVDSLGRQGHAHGEYTVGPGPNELPEITVVAFNCEDLTMDVSVRDLNPNQTLYVTVTEPAGFHADTPGKFAATTGPLTAEFTWTVDPPGIGMWGTTTVTVEDTHGATTTRDVVLVLPEADTLYAVPMQTSVAVDEPVDILVLTGATFNPFSYLCMVGITVEPGAQYVDSSFNIGACGGSFKERDGIWATMSPAPGSFFMSENFMIAAGDNGDGRDRFEFSILPTGVTQASDLLGQPGDLFNFQFQFTAPGTYTLGFVESTGTVSRTYFSDWDEYEYYWGDITNSHPGLITTITVE